MCSSDLCTVAAQRVLGRLGWEPDSIDALIMVTQTPDYFLPSTACVVHHRLGLADHCAAFDVGLGCSGYPYGSWRAAMMLQGGGVRRALVLHGETPTRFSDKGDRSVSLLFGDAGSATALESTDPRGTTDWHYALHTDGSGYNSMIIESGGFRDRFGSDPRKHCVNMNGALIFNFTIKRVPTVIDETLAGAGVTFEKKNPVAALMTDPARGEINPEILNEKILSAIVEAKTTHEMVPRILAIIEQVGRRLDTVISVGVGVRCEPDGSAPIESALREHGYEFVRGKTNLGLGRRMPAAASATETPVPAGRA